MKTANLTKERRLVKKTDNPKLGIIYILMAAFFFALMSFFVRLSGDVPTMQKAFFRNLVAVGAATVMLARSKEGFKIQKGCVPDLLLRAAFGTLGLLCNFWAIDRLNIADANMLNKLAPFFAILMSVFLLKEKPNKMEWICVFVAFAGAAFVVKPTAGLASLPALIGALGGFGAGTAYTFVRKLGKRGERGPVIVMFFSLFSCLATLPFILFDYAPMEGWQLGCLLLAGAAATGGQLSVTAAYTKAPAKEISVFDFSQVLFAAMLGFFFFGEMPDAYSVIGYCVIIGIAVVQWYYDTRRAGKAS
ncbi:MAG: DMT family transporter [Christensenella sp.]|nr:DMT family transporter [Christensenella sp.]